MNAGATFVQGVVSNSLLYVKGLLLLEINHYQGSTHLEFIST